MASTISKPEYESRSISPTDVEAGSTGETPNHTYPDGGRDAWLQCLGLFCVSVATWGLINSYGVFQVYYSAVTLKGRPPQDISWIGSIQMFLMIGLGAPIAPLVDAGYFRHLMASGSFLIVLGTMMTSLAKTYTQIFLAQGVCTGVGMGLIYMPAMVCVNSWFDKRKGIAMGLGIMGSSIAGVCFPILMRHLYLKPNIEFAWTVRIIAFIVLLALLTANLTMRPNFAKNHRAAPKPAITDLFDWPFTLYAAGAVIGFLGVFIPYFYLSSHAILLGINRDLSFYLLSIMNGASVFGRVLPNLLADRVGGLNSSIPFALASGALLFGWIGIETEEGLIALAVLYGFFSGAFVSLPPMVIGTMTPNVNHLAMKVGVGFMLLSPAMLAGPPIAGALWRGGDMVGTQAFAGSTAVVAGVFFVAARWKMVGWRVWVKV
ncbi:MFS general substrate transporter [Ascobolus immersus RN42]|uniref:MFS general substrate transporter n=1 Tax=Ascobolus immersus RN42 TaxID=1160509 RepID=A0A3N4II46_ASCIM|nr:MFS general substrate transporter [Ascobolus immersus RN42]